MEWKLGDPGLGKNAACYSTSDQKKKNVWKCIKMQLDADIGGTSGKTMQLDTGNEPTL